MHPLERKITEKLVQELLTDDDQCIVLGVSGGSDSIALLHIMSSLQKEKGLELVAVYVNHGLRPEETEQEEKLVGSQCNELGVRFESIDLDVYKHAEQDKKSGNGMNPVCYSHCMFSFS